MIHRTAHLDVMAKTDGVSKDGVNVILVLVAMIAARSSHARQRTVQVMVCAALACVLVTMGGVEEDAILLMPPYVQAPSRMCLRRARAMVSVLTQNVGASLDLAVKIVLRKQLATVTAQQVVASTEIAFAACAAAIPVVAVQTAPKL